MRKRVRAVKGPELAGWVRRRVGTRTKSLVLKAQNCLPCGFDSHRPLHSQATPGPAGLQDWSLDIDPMGESCESTLTGAVVSWPHVSPIHTYSHTQQFTKINRVIRRCGSIRDIGSTSNRRRSLTGPIEGAGPNEIVALKRPSRRAACHLLTARARRPSSRPLPQSPSRNN
jgi:hypothetical protein